MKFDISDKRLKCHHCGNDNFKQSSAQLNTSMMSFFDLDWLNKTSTIYICSSCGRIEWFTSPTEGYIDDKSEKADCLACGGTIPAGEIRCRDCGWTYQ